MILLRLLVLPQVLLCLVAALPSQIKPIEDDYDLVRVVAEKLLGSRDAIVDKKVGSGDAIDQKVDSDALPAVEETAKDHEQDQRLTGLEDEEVAESFPVVVDKFAPDTDPDSSEEYEDNNDGKLVNPGKELLALPVLVRRLSLMLLKDIMLAEEGEGFQARGQSGEDIPKDKEVSAEEAEDLSVESEEEEEDLSEESEEEEVGNNVSLLRKNVDPVNKGKPVHDTYFHNRAPIPEVRENIYENNEELSGGMIFPVNQAAYGDTFEHQVGRMGDEREDLEKDINSRRVLYRNPGDLPGQLPFLGELLAGDDKEIMPGESRPFDDLPSLKSGDSELSNEDSD